MAKKFDSALSALEQINANTTKTNQLLLSQLKLDKDQEQRAKRDKIAADEKDKPSNSIAKVAKGVGGPVAKKGKDSLLNTLGLAAGLFALSALMEILPKLPKLFDEFKEGLEDLGQQLRGWANVKTTKDVIRFTSRLDGKGGDLKESYRTTKAMQEEKARIEAEKKAKAEADRIRRMQAYQNMGETKIESNRQVKSKGAYAQYGKSRATAFKSLQLAEAERLSRINDADPRDLLSAEEKQKREQIRAKKKAIQASLNKKIQTNVDGLGDVAYNPETSRFQKVTAKNWGSFVKTDEAVAAINKAQAMKPPTPSMDDIPKVSPKPFKPPKINLPDDAPVLSSDPEVPKTKTPGVGSRLLNSIPGSGVVKAGAKVLGPVGTFFSLKAGLQNEEMEKAGYGEGSRMTLQVMSDFIDVGDGLVNVSQGIYSWLKNEGFMKGFKNDTDLSGSFENVLTQNSGVRMGVQTALTFIPGVGWLLQGDTGVGKAAADRLDEKTDKIRQGLGFHKDDQERVDYIQKMQTVYSRDLERAMKDGVINEREEQRLNKVIESINNALQKMSEQGQAAIVNQINNSNTLLPQHQLKIETPDIDN